MGRAKFSSKFLSLFLRILLLVSWGLLVVSFALAVILTLYPNLTVNGDGLDPNNPIFGVWKIKLTGKGIGSAIPVYGTRTITNQISWLGWLLIGLSIVAVVFSIIIQSIAKGAKFKIGSRNQMIGYFSSINFPLIVFVVFAFLGTYHFNTLTTIPGVHGQVQSMFLTQPGAYGTAAKPWFGLAYANSFPLELYGRVTWVYCIFLAFAGIFSISIVVTTIKLVIRAVFSRTFDKNYVE